VAQKVATISEVRRIQQSKVLKLVLDIICVNYFLTSITMPDPQSSDKRPASEMTYIVSDGALNSTHSPSDKREIR